MTDIKPLIFDVKYEREFSFNIQGYLKYCETNNRQPTQKGYERYCEVLIYEIMMTDNTEIMMDIEIKKREDHIEAISKLT
jgi:hypothetical protein